jgi:hypothetical protein
METPRKPLNKYWCSVSHYLSHIRNIYIKVDRFPLMMLTAANSRFAITRVIVLESSHLFLTEGMYTSG